jgi:hypothetical membrane protein
VVPVLDMVITAWLGALDPGYSHARQYISELGEDGRPYAAVFNAWCLAYGVLLAGFAVALGRGLGSRSVFIALLTVAATSIAGGVFPCDPGCAGRSPSARVHFLTGYVSLAAILLTPFLAWFAMSGNPVWRGHRAFTLASGGLLVAAMGWLAACHYSSRGPTGVAQRLVLGVQYAWMVVLAVRLWRLEGQRSVGLATSADSLDSPGPTPG